MNPSRSWLWWLLLVPLAFGVARLRFDTEILNLLPDKLAVAQGLKIYQQHFSDARELIITLDAPSAEDAESAARALAQALRTQSNLVADVVWQPVWLEHPTQAAELIAFLWLNQPPSVFGELASRLAVTRLTNTLQETRERLATSFSPHDLAIAGYDPYGLMRLPESVSGAAPALGSGDDLFSSREGTFRLLFVEAKPDLTGYRACRSWMADIQHVITEVRRSGQFPAQAELHFTGRPAFVTEIAGGMEDDLAGSSGGTLATIGILFWLTHRRLRPLFWLLVLLLLILGGTAALGGLGFGRINVVSLGFASILLGLAEDFGILVYQELRSHPELTLRELRRAVAPGIFWSAVTTASAFLTLNLSSVPGLGQLGSLVAIGITVAAVVMLYGYLPLLRRFPSAADRDPLRASRRERFLLFQPVKLLPPPVIWLLTLVLLVVAGGLVWQGGLRFDRSPRVLEPKRSDAKATLERIKSRFGGGQEPLWVLVPGQEEAEVGQRLAQVRAVLSQAASNHLIVGFTLPTALWPQPDHQKANRPALAVLLQERRLLRDAALGAGFTPAALVVTENILDCWGRAMAGDEVFWPTNRASQWLLGKVAARTGRGFLALGLVHPTTQAAATKSFAASWPRELQDQGVILSGWELLGTTIFDLVMRELPRVLIPIGLLVVVSLWLAFRNLKEVLLSLITLAFSALLLGAAMHVLRWDWNLLNLMALPLMLGMGVDFSIHMQLALRHHGGDRLAVRRSVGRAPLLAGATTVAGFGSLAFSTNGGLASLGKVCALGITLSLVTAVYLLPVWWAAGRTGATGDRARSRFSCDT